MIGNKSYAEFIRDVIDKVYKKYYYEGYKKGYEEGKNDYAIWYYCDICNKPIYMLPNANSHKYMIEYMREHGWAHKRCHAKVDI